MPARRLALVSAGVAVGAALLLAGTAAAEPGVTLEGVLVVSHEDHFDSGRSRHAVTLRTGDGAVVELRFGGDDRAHELSGRRVRVRGERRGIAVAVTAAEGVAPPVPAAPAAAGDGPLHVAVVMFGFSDVPLAPSPAQITQLAFGGAEGTPSVRAYYDEVSYGRMPVDGVVLDAGPIDAASTDACDYDEWGRQARQQLGLLESQYTHVTHVMPPSSCRFGGVAQLPGRHSWVVTGPITDEPRERRFRGVMSHELGHNLGAHHGGSYACKAVRGHTSALGSRCVLSEYGDPFTVLGTSWGERHLNGFQKASISARAPEGQRRPWLDDPDVQVISGQGTHSVVLSPIETPEGLEVLRIPRPGSPSESYYLELRGAASGFDSGDLQYPQRRGKPLFNPAPSGVLVRLAPTEPVPAVTRLLDMTPRTSTFTDAALVEGRPYIDGALTITFHGLDAATGHAQLTVALAVEPR